MSLYTSMSTHLSFIHTLSDRHSIKLSDTLFLSQSPLFTLPHPFALSHSLSHTDNSIELDIRVTVTATTTIIVTTTPPITPTSTSTTTSTVTTTTTTHTPRSSQVSLNVDMTLIQLVVYAPQYVELNDPRSLPQH